MCVVVERRVVLAGASRAFAPLGAVVVSVMASMGGTSTMIIVM